jgi:hypothetical protein
MQRFHDFDDIPTNMHFVVPGRQSKAQTNPEPSTRAVDYWVADFADEIMPEIRERHDPGKLQAFRPRSGSFSAEIGLKNILRR